MSFRFLRIVQAYGHTKQSVLTFVILTKQILDETDAKVIVDQIVRERRQ